MDNFNYFMCHNTRTFNQLNSQFINYSKKKMNDNLSKEKEWPFAIAVRIASLISYKLDEYIFSTRNRQILDNHNLKYSFNISFLTKMYVPIYLIQGESLFHCVLNY